jgi:hypothetical protein
VVVGSERVLGLQIGDTDINCDVFLAILIKLYH